jgi:triosephosphate isomerase
MHGLKADLHEIDSIAALAARTQPHVDILICPPASLLAAAARTAAGRIAVGGQDCSPEASGAHTGDISAEMLKDAGAGAVIVGHSERRQHHGETDALVSRKALAARRAGLLAVLCVGETQKQHASGAALSICGDQIVASVPQGMNASGLAIGYEPLWAIGSGQIPTSQEIVHMHAHIRRCLVEHLGAEGKNVRILYGGSVKPSNARAILALPEVGGALVGGASLKSEEFAAIFASAPQEGATIAAE